MADPIVIVGATGLIGSLLVRQLRDDNGFDDVHVIVREKRDINYDGVTVHVAPSVKWSEIIAEIQPHAIVSCLGSTMKKAGSKNAFAAVDRDLVSALAKAAKNAGAKHMIAVSSTMANSYASSYYLKIKGQAEDKMRAQRFDRLDLIRPGLLRGERTNDQRAGESFAIAVSPLMDKLLHGSFRRYRSIDASAVAKAMVVLLNEQKPGQFIHENDEIWDLN
ncbi:NAD(P)H-binding protein [Parasphingorhabdus sp.]|uniref:NAD(P)H-binding protein n=1 Tax=Parasphingorhabdus sp. TaxID=2709688 RepID=UPI0032636F25